MLKNENLSKINAKKAGLGFLIFNIRKLLITYN